MQNLKILGVPFYFGQPHRGVSLAPFDLRGSGLVSKLEKFAKVIDLGNVSFLDPSDEEKDSIKNVFASSAGCQNISEAIRTTSLHDDFLLTIGGDHGMALGSIHGLLYHHPESVVVWADAHGDINTPETSPSGNFHGMPLAFLLQLAKHPQFEWMRNFLLPKKLILIGPRDLDAGEKEIIKQNDIQYYSSEELNRLGAKEILEMALHRADPHGVCPIHLSFDVDLFDQFDIHSTGTRVAHGPKLEEVFFMGGWLAQTGRLKSMDIVEFNPSIGDCEEVQRSRALVLDFITTTLKEVFPDHSKSVLSTQVLLRAFSRDLFEETI